MDARIDFLQLLDIDVVLLILMFLDDPRDLIRASAVSRFWRNFVITHQVCKTHCLRLFPQLARVSSVVKDGEKNHADVGSSSYMEWEALEREHRVYAFLIQSHKAYEIGDCIRTAISATSDRAHSYIQSVSNTLFEVKRRNPSRDSYWSSKGKTDHAVPERLTYKLMSDFCAVTEIGVQLFLACAQSGSPTYSTISVRFRLGHPKFPSHLESDFSDLILQPPVDDKFIWTYTSQEFAMAQDDSLQMFKLPETVLCIGGFMQIELLGSVEKQETGGVYYICVFHVKALGHNLYPAFDVEIPDNSKEFVLKYDPNAQTVRFKPRTLRASSLRSRKSVLRELGFPDGYRIQHFLDPFLLEVDQSLRLAMLGRNPLSP